MYLCFRTCVCVCDFERENKKSKLLCLGFWWLLWSNWRTWSWGFCFWVSDLGWWTWYWGFCFWVSDPNWWTWSWPLGVYFLGFWSRSVCGGLGLQENFFFLLGHRLAPEVAWAGRDLRSGFGHEKTRPKPGPFPFLMVWVSYVFDTSYMYISTLLNGLGLTPYKRIDIQFFMHAIPLPIQRLLL